MGAAPLALAAASLLAPLVVTACTTVRSRSSFGDGAAAVAIGRPVDRWDVLAPDGSLVGHAIRFVSDGDRGPRSFVSVRNAWQQEIGFVDETGRAFRHQPFAEEARWLGTGTIADGVRSILAPATDVHLRPSSEPRPR